MPGTYALLRRKFVTTASSALAAAALPSILNPGSALAWEQESVGATYRFDYAWLKGRARLLATKPHQTVVTKLPAPVANLTWDQYQAIRFRKEQALWVKSPARFRAQFFHLGLYFKRPVRLFELENGQARQIAVGVAQIWTN